MAKRKQNPDMRTATWGELYPEKKRKKRRRAKGKTVTTTAKSIRRPQGKSVVTTSRTVRRTNPRLLALYAKKGREVLKYVGGNKFAKRGRAMLFRSGRDVRNVAHILRKAWPHALKGWKLTVRP